jgi:MFS family permease
VARPSLRDRDRVGLISVVSVILLRDEYGMGAFVFALLASVPAGVFASGVVIGIGVGLISVVSVILLRDEYGMGAFVFALLASVPAGVFASGVVIGTPREYMRGRRQRTP